MLLPAVADHEADLLEGLSSVDVLRVGKGDHGGQGEVSGLETSQRFQGLLDTVGVADGLACLIGLDEGGDETEHEVGLFLAVDVLSVSTVSGSL